MVLAGLDSRRPVAPYAVRNGEAPGGAGGAERRGENLCRSQMALGRTADVKTRYSEGGRGILLLHLLHV